MGPIPAIIGVIVSIVIVIGLLSRDGNDSDAKDK
jgi:hypothetical protein